MLIHRRSLLLGLVSSLAAPAIVRAGVIMPVKTMIWDGRVPIIIHPRVSVRHGVEPFTYASHAIKSATGQWHAWDPYRKFYRAMSWGCDGYPRPVPVCDWNPSEGARQDAYRSDVEKTHTLYLLDGQHLTS